MFVCLIEMILFDCVKSISFTTMIGKRVERCNGQPLSQLRFGRKLSRFLEIAMKPNYYTIDRLRQSYFMHWAAMIILSIAILVSVPHFNFHIDSISSHIHKIVPLDTIPLASPGQLSRQTNETAEFSSDVINLADLEEHLQIFSTLEQRSLFYARTFTSSLIYTQTTSSYL